MGRIDKTRKQGSKEHAGNGAIPKRRPFLSIDVARRSAGIIVSPHGRVTELVAGVLEDRLLGLIEEGAANIVLDMDDVPFISSAGLGAIMLAYKEAQKRKCCLRLARCQPLVKQILETTKLIKLFGADESVEDALAGH